ncbi:L10-interacting MYB domain-containing protein [Drosera capensis]
MWGGVIPQKSWSKLIRTDFMKWDPTTGQFGANEEEWACYIQANHPDAALLQYKTFEHTDQLEIIFSGVTGQGEAEVSERPTQRRKHDKNILSTNLSDVEPKDVEPERIEPLCEAVESRPQNEHPDRASANLMLWNLDFFSAVTVQSIQGERKRIQGDLFAVEEANCENCMVETTAISQHAAIMFVLQDDLATRWLGLDIPLYL